MFNSLADPCSKWSKLSIDLWLTIAVFVIIPINHIGRAIMFYKYGLTLSEPWGDITGIQAWLDTLDVDNLTVSRVSEYGTWIYSDNWPNPIKKLLFDNGNPKDYPPKRVLIMKSKNGKTYVRVPYVRGAALVVGVGAEEIPLNDCHVSEYRLEIAPNAFVGYRLKHAKQNVGF